MNNWIQRLPACATSWWPGSAEFALPDLTPASAPSAAPLKVLLVVAHPDDESECAATLYRISHELGGIVDQVVVTDGGGGRNFIAPALDYYGVPGKQNVGKQLPDLRRRELRRAGRIIGIRKQYWLAQKDSGYTLDPGEGFRSWNLPQVRGALQRILARGQYDAILTLLPTGDTHGHHQTVAILALEAASQVPEATRPAILGVRAGSGFTGEKAGFEVLPGFPATATTTAHPVWSFDRRTPLTQNADLDHSIIVHWVIAEHKSQGMFQMEYGKHTHEHFWQFAAGGARWEALRKLLIQPLGAQRPFALAEAA
ncbi:MAG TPA: PIG-L family deacetylase [Bryobacteraceae bacterium]|nr:PIG-L family deacetylase [Bryobacteraceae bacterium]